MKNKITEMYFRFRHRRDLHIHHVLALWAVCLLLLAGTIYVYQAEGVLGFAYANRYRAEIQSARKQIGQEAARYLQVSHALAQDEQMIQIIRNHDRDSAIKYLKDQTATYGIQGLIAIDQNGTVLSRTLTGQSGDVVFQTRSWGQRVASGEDVATVIEGTGFPLMILAGTPIRENGQLIGAVGAGNFLDSPHLREFFRAAVPETAEIVSYTRDRGVVGSTFSDPDIHEQITEFFGPGTDWIQADKSNTIVRIRDRRYIVANLTIPRLDQVAGGVLFLFPFTPFPRGFAIAGSATVAAIALILAANSLRSRPRKDRRWLTAIGALGSLAFLAGLYLSALLPSLNTVDITAPDFTIYNATMSLDPASSIFETSFNQRIAIRLTTGGESINALDIGLRYDPTRTQVTAIDTSRSFCDPDLEAEKTIDQVRGLIRLACGLPSPGVTGPNLLVAELVLRQTQPGVSNVVFEADSSVQANDGIGTDVLRQATGATYVGVDFGRTSDPAQPPTLYSTTHPNQTRWYASRTVRLNWSGQPGLYVYSVDQNPSAQPGSDLFTQKNNLVVRIPKDGEYYFHVARLTNGTLGPVAHYRIRADTTRPERPVVKATGKTIRSNEVARFAFAGTDEHSGMQKRFYLKIDRGTFYPVQNDVQMTLAPGRHTLVVRGFDLAGNFNDRSVVVKVQKARR